MLPGLGALAVCCCVLLCCGELANVSFEGCSKKDVKSSSSFSSSEERLVMELLDLSSRKVVGTTGWSSNGSLMADGSYR